MASRLLVRTAALLLAAILVVAAAVWTGLPELGRSGGAPGPSRSPAADHGEHAP